MNTDVESLTNFHKLPNRISANSRIKYPQTPEWFIFSSYRKITFLGKTRSNPPHPSTKHTSMAIQLKTGNERQVSGFGFCNWKPEIRNSEPPLQVIISLKTAAYSLMIFTIASRVCPHRIRHHAGGATSSLPVIRTCGQRGRSPSHLTRRLPTSH